MGKCLFLRKGDRSAICNAQEAPCPKWVRMQWYQVGPTCWELDLDGKRERHTGPKKK